MGLATTRQKEVDLLLKEANEMLADVQGIENICAKYSEKFHEIGSSVKGVASDIANSIKKERGNKNDLLGDAIGIGGMLLGGLISDYGERKAEKKRYEMNMKLLPQKQAIAREKLARIENMIPKVKNLASKTKLECEKESKMLHDNHDEETFENLKNQYQQLFDIYSKFTYLENTCIFFRDEFKA